MSPAKKKSAKSIKPTKPGRKVAASRTRKPSTPPRVSAKNKGGKPEQPNTVYNAKALDKCNFQSFTDIIKCLKWLAMEVYTERIPDYRADSIRRLLDSAKDAAKMKLQSEGKWTEKTENTNKELKLTATIGDLAKVMKTSDPKVVDALVNMVTQEGKK